VLLEQLQRELAEHVSIRTQAAGDPSSDIDITDVVHDSRQARPGTLFCAVPGLTVDGHDFVDAAIANGAAAVMVEHSVDVDCPQLTVTSVRRSMAYAAAAVHGYPSRQIAVVGITGTNGKTTTTQLLASIIRSTSKTCAVVGTLDGAHTTPESPDLQRLLRSAVDDGIDVVAMEVSSHALDQYRADAVDFAVAAFSNLTPDHLDFHGDMQSYFDAKARLFDGRARVAVVNIDDPWGSRLAEQHPDAVQLSIKDHEILDETIAGTTFLWREQATFVPLPGQMNVANALMAAELASVLGIDDDAVVAGLGAADPVPGRMEIVRATAPDQPAVVVDYSHTPDSIERALATLRSVSADAKISIVFGCGGDRDRAKRPLMGRAAEAGADRVYVTNDNPRSEEPRQIIDQARAGMNYPDRAIVEVDRKAAITRAIIDAAPGDVVLIAGKGHEKTQTIGSNVLPFDDVQVALEILKAPLA